MKDDIIGSFSFDVTKRMLQVLQDHGSLRKTNLAQKTGLNYNTCSRYIDMLVTLGWLERSSDRYYISITEVGRQVRGRLLDISAGTEAGTTSIITGDLPDKEPSRPVLREEKEREKQKSKRSKRVSPTGKSLNIMIVDDEPDILTTYQYFLTPEGYNVRIFSNAYSALREFTSRPYSYFDLVILDIRMPGLNGLQLYQSFKALNPSCKIVFISALDAAREMVSILPGVASVSIIKKPVDAESFLRKIREILGDG